MVLPHGVDRGPAREGTAHLQPGRALPGALPRRAAGAAGRDARTDAPPGHHRVPDPGRGDAGALRIAGVDCLADDSRRRDAGRSGRLLPWLSDRAHAAADRAARARGALRRQPVPHEPLPVPGSAARDHGSAKAHGRAAPHHAGHRVPRRGVPLSGARHGHARGHRSRCRPGRDRRARRRERIGQEHAGQAALPPVRPRARRHFGGWRQPARSGSGGVAPRNQRRVPGPRALCHDRGREHLAGRHREARRPGRRLPAPASARARMRW